MVVCSALFPRLLEYIGTSVFLWVCGYFKQQDSLETTLSAVLQ